VKPLSVPGAPQEQSAKPAEPVAPQPKPVDAPQPPPAIQQPTPVAQPPVAPPPINVAGQPLAVPAINPPALPGNRMAQLNMVVAAVWSNNVVFAAQQLKQMMAAYPGDAEIARYWVLIQLAAGGDNAGAKAVADQLLVTHPADAQVLMAHGQAALFNKDQAGAVRSINAAYAMAPFLINGIYDEANRLRGQGVYSVAYIQYISLTWMNPPSSGAFYGLGYCAEALGRREEAIESFERYLQMEPRSPYTAEVRQRLAQLRRH
ncbi:MAG TPA: tetratricopeptide repeat protein, partial [Kiritimatiellia bacterium]|jgi:tetratricopeptide (TPR) repeat protein